MSARRIHPALIYGGVVSVGLATLTVSAYFQYQLGLLAGSTVVALTLPVALDAGGFVASACWLIGYGALRAWGRGVAIALVVASTVVNVLAHGLLHGPEWAAIGLVYPLVFFAMVKLALLYQEQRADLADGEEELVTAQQLRQTAAGEREKRRREDEAALVEAQRTRDETQAVLQQTEQVRRDIERETQRTEKARQKQAVSQQPQRNKQTQASQPASREERREWVRQQRADGRHVTGGDVDREFGPPRTGAAIVREVEAEQAPHIYAVAKEA